MTNKPSQSENRLRVEKRISELNSQLLIQNHYVTAWENLLTDEERERLGGDLKQCWRKTPNLVALWIELRGKSQVRTILDLAHDLHLLVFADYQRFLSEVGESETEADGPVKPVWDAARRELRYRGRPVRRVRSASVASTISPILDAFQAQGWPAQITHAVNVSLSRQPLYDAVRKLNRGLQEIRFHVDDDFIYWTVGEVVESPSLGDSAGV